MGLVWNDYHTKIYVKHKGTGTDKGWSHNWPKVNHYHHKLIQSMNSLRITRPLKRQTVNCSWHEHRTKRSCQIFRPALLTGSGHLVSCFVANNNELPIFPPYIIPSSLPAPLPTALPVTTVLTDSKPRFCSLGLPGREWTLRKPVCQRHEAERQGWDDRSKTAGAEQVPTQVMKGSSSGCLYTTPHHSLVQDESSDSHHTFIFLPLNGFSKTPS